MYIVYCDFNMVLCTAVCIRIDTLQLHIGTSLNQTSLYKSNHNTKRLMTTIQSNNHVETVTSALIAPASRQG